MGFDRQLSAALPSAGSALMTRSIAALAAVLLGVPLLAFVALASAKYPGTIERCLLFQFSFLLMAALAIPRPRSYAFGYFSGALGPGVLVEVQCAHVLPVRLRRADRPLLRFGCRMGSRPAVVERGSLGHQHSPRPASSVWDCSDDNRKSRRQVHQAGMRPTAHGCGGARS